MSRGKKTGRFSLSSFFSKRKQPNEISVQSGRRAAIVDALNKAIEIFTSHNEKTFDEVMTNGIRPVAEAAGMDRVVFYRRMDIDGKTRFGQIYRWDKSEDSLISIDDELKVVPDTPLMIRWISILSNDGIVRIRESDMTEDELVFSRVFGIKSIMIMPIFTNGEFWGGVALQDHANDRYFDEDCADLLHASMRLFANAIIREEMTQSAEKAIKALKRREKMSETLNMVSLLFLSQTENAFEDTMTAGVRLLVNAVDVDRFSIWRNTMMGDGLHTSQIYRWDKESGGTTAPTKGLEDVTYAQLAPRWEEMLAKNETINSPVQLLPEAAMLKSFGVVSAFIVPVLFNNEFWGFVLFEDRKNERYFDEDSAEMMRWMAFLCVNTVLRAEMEHKVAEANERTKLMLDTIPISCQWWDKNMNVIDCNNAAVKLFGLKDKQEFFDTFFDLNPEYQPNGRRSDVMALEAVKKAFEDESYGFDWMHRLKDGTLMEAEVNLERIQYKDEEAVLVGYVRDMREQKRLMREIEQEKEYNRNILDAAPFGINIFDENLVMFDCNDSVSKLFGCEKEYYLKHFFELSPECQDDGLRSDEKAVALITKALNGENQIVEWTHHSLSGELLPFELTLTRVMYKGKYIVVVYQYDMRRIRKMEQEMLNQSELNRAMIESAPIGITVFDENLHFFNCNDVIVSAYGGTKDQFINNFFDFSPEYQNDGSKSAEKIKDIMERTFNGKNQVFEWTHRSIKGVEMPFEITTTRVKHDEKYIGIAFQYNLSRIVEAEKMTRAVIQASPVSYVLFDDNFKVIDCNDEMLRMLDCPDKQFVMNHYWELFVPELQSDGTNSYDKTKAIRKTVSINEKNTFEWLHKSLKGEIIPVDNTLTQIMYKGRKVFVTFKYDLRGIKKMENRLQEAVLKATEASKAKSNFLSNMSHEMRTPLNAIIGMTTIGKNAADIEHKDQALDKIDKASANLLGIINDVLDMSKIEANMLELSPEEFHFEKMLQRVVNVVNFRVEEKHQNFTVHIDKQMPQVLIGDDQRIAQVITNLLGNAVKFTPEKGSIRLEIRLLGEENGLCTIQVSVKDTGIGMTPEQMERVFISFEQAESTTTRKFGGTGLGLAISKNIVEMMDGKIWIESELKKGAAFIFTIRIRRGTAKKHGLFDSTINLGNVRIMVVDDDPDILNYVKEVVQGIGASCDTAIGGKEALKIVEENGTYNIYFIDWKMPIIDGITLTAMLREKTSVQGNTVVIMISAAEWNTVEKEARKAGVDKFLSKPLFSSTIVDVISECLGVNQETDEQGPPDINGCFAGRRILLAEDVEINREILLGLLEPTEIIIDCAENGREAVRMFSEVPQKYELIFMDVQMPEMDGYEATRLIRKLDAKNAKTIPIIAMTANVFREDIEKCLQVGMNGHIGKPLDNGEVIDKLRSYLPREQLSQEN